jgi:type II secretory pathway component GspD/PulD (secretin)
VPAAARQNPAGAAAVTFQDGADRRVSLDFVAADINDVLKALSLQSGINIVTGADVKGNITVSLKRISLPEALDMVTRLSGFQYARFGSAYVVGTPSSVASITAGGKPSAEPVTGFIRYRYTPTSQLYKVLAEKFPGVRLPELDKDSAASAALAGPAFPKLLVVTDAKERVEAVGAFVETLEGQIQLPTVGSATEIYRIRYANPNDLITILSRLVPTVAVQVGPNQVFQGASGNGSATFGGGGSFGPATGGGGAGAAGGGAGGGANLGAGNNGGTANPVGPAGANLLLITGAPSDIARAREVLNQIDIKTSQIIYEARVVDVNASDLQQLGLRYDLSRSVNVGESNAQATRGGIASPSLSGEFPGRNPTFGAIFRSPYSIGVTLDALANNNRARTLANPNLAALDGQPATAFIGDQIKYVIAVQQTQQGQTIQTETATVGITLRVTGKASPDGTITLYVHPEVSSVTSFLNLANGISLPQIATRFVDTTIRVKDGETIAIGGLIREQDVKNLQKVPLIGDLPLLGQLFRRSEKRKERSELVVFVTARIAKD